MLGETLASVATICADIRCKFTENHRLRITAPKSSVLAGCANATELATSIAGNPLSGVAT